jgi:hypothetical protein
MTVLRITDQECADCFENLWRGAFERRPFDTICTLLRVAGIQDAGWDPFEESAQAFEDYNWHFHAQSEELSEKSPWRVGLLMYCHACEMSAVHDMLANILRIHVNRPYHFNPLGSLGRANKQRGFIPPSAKGKWEEICSMAEQAKRTDLVRLIGNVYNDMVRNAFSHSDYIIGEKYFRWTESGLPGQIPLEDLNNLISNSFSFFSIFMEIRERWRGFVAKMPRYHRWPNFEVFEILKTDGKVDGFQVHFSNGNSARFRREPEGVVDLMNMIPQPDGVFSFNVGQREALGPRYVVGGKEVQFGDRTSFDQFDAV